MDNNLYALPWAIKEMPLHEGGEGFEVKDKDGEIVLDNQTFYPEPPSYDNAAFIVRAVNSHDALVAALKEMMCVYGQCLPDHCNADWFDDYNRAVAALAAAGEQP